MSNRRQSPNRARPTRVRGTPARHRAAGRRVTAKAAAARRRAQTIAFAVAAAAVLTGVVALAVVDHSSTAGYDTNPQAFALPSLGSPGKVQLASFRGHPVVVNFFASWCTQCAGELPVFDADARALKGRIDFVEVNAEETGDGRAFAQHYNLAASVTAVASDVGGSQGDGLYRALGGNGSMPMTAFYAPDGSLLTTQTGAFDSSTLAAKLQQLYRVNAPA